MGGRCTPRPSSGPRETARPIARAVGLRVRTHRGLNECDFGEWTGAQLGGLRKRAEWRTVQQLPERLPLPRRGVLRRDADAHLPTRSGTWPTRHPGETVVALSHADPIKAAVADALGTHLDLFQRIVISTCSVTAIHIASTGPVVLTVNATSDLGELKLS
ncbi:MAG: histidine phosphatase family protein [Acidimicrobiia bacterium]|nr:histidine phosphatase family protein [Acidimicrobiia bacterium]